MTIVSDLAYRSVRGPPPPGERGSSVCDENQLFALKTDVVVQCAPDKSKAKFDLFWNPKMSKHFQS